MGLILHQVPLQSINLLILIVLLAAFVVPLDGTAIDSQDVQGKQHIQPQAKQGILEIPKNVATVIRNYIDSTLQTYLQLTTPKPNPQKPPELSDSIIGHYLLANLYATPGPAPAYNPQTAAGIASQVITSNEPTYNIPMATTQPAAAASAPAAAAPPPPASSPEFQLSGQTTKPRIRVTTKAPPPVHTLDTHPGIYNAYGVNLNPTDPDEVYYIGDPTKPSVIIPIQPNTARPPPTTEQPTAKSTTEEGDGGDDGEEETSREDLPFFFKS